jgi:probable F420-dependent oxidoreductase
LSQSRKIGATLPILNQAWDEFPRMAAAADQAGLDTLFDYEFWRNPFVIHALNCGVTERVTLATGLATAANRAPFEMANGAADLDELSGGRALLGMGMGSSDFADGFAGTDISHPATRLREYIKIVRMSWEYLETGDSMEFVGKYYRFRTPEFNPFNRRELVRPRIPIYVAALRPAMLRMAGEVADGVLGYLMTPKYTAEVVLPNLVQGAKRAGRDPQDIDIASETITSIHPDREEAYRRARIHVGTYICYPVSIPMVNFMGYEQQRLEVLDAFVQEGPACLERVVGDELVDAFSITGTPEEARQKMAEYHEILPHVVMHTPYVPGLTAEESADTFYHNVQAFAHARA